MRNREGGGNPEEIDNSRRGFLGKLAKGAVGFGLAAAMPELVKAAENFAETESANTAPESKLEAPPPPEIEKEIMQRFVRLTIGKKDYQRGSGIVVGPGLVLTNFHVHRVMPDKEIQAAGDSTEHSKWIDGEEVKILAASEKYDVMLVRVPTKGVRPLDLNNSPKERQDVWGVKIDTNLNTADKKVHYKPVIKKGKVLFPKGTLTSPVENEGFAEKFNDADVATDLDVYDGWSGGPVYGENGFVGMIRAMAQYPKNVKTNEPHHPDIGIFISSEKIKELVTKLEHPEKLKKITEVVFPGRKEREDKQKAEEKKKAEDKKKHKELSEAEKAKRKKKEEEEIMKEEKGKYTIEYFDLDL